MSLRINDKLEVKIGQTPVDSNISLLGEDLPHVMSVKLVMDVNDPKEITRLLIEIGCLKIENMEEEE